jgi:uncharacterized protein YPO0396
MPEPGARTAVRRGQYRLTRLQVVNWGSFAGYRDLPVDERGVLFTGPSGAGKSQLLDAHSVALLPRALQQFNASADLTARGSKQAARTIADYVRGRWSENDDEHGQAQPLYLRGGRPTWTAVAATYDDRLGKTVTGAVVRWFTGTETDSAHLQALWLVHDGHFDLRALEAWAQDGFATARLQRDYPPPATRFPRTETEYTAMLARHAGLGADPKAALALLGRAKALKNVGDLNLFIRDNMLDTPSTYAAATRMGEVFTPLDEAYRTAERAQDQQLVLAPVPAAWAAYRASGEEGALLDSLDDGVLGDWLRDARIRLLESAVGTLTEARPGLEARVASLQARTSEARAEYRSLDDQVRREGAELERLEADHERAASQQATRHGSYQRYAAQATLAGFAPLPEDLEAFLAVAASLPSRRTALQADRDRLHGAWRKASHAAGEASQAHRAVAGELERLRAAKSMIPPRALDRRADIARAAGAAPGDLPYAAELVDVADGEDRWRPAAERVLRGFGLRLLIPRELSGRAAAWIDANDMRGIVEYSIITSVSAHQPQPAPGTLASKLTVTPGHPASTWLAAQVATQFRHACVEDAAALKDHDLAVTVGGTVKSAGNRYRKDDRPETASPSSWILGGSRPAKLQALEAEAARLEAEAATAGDAERGLDTEVQQATAARDAAVQLGGYASWDDLDHWSSAALAARLAARIGEARASSTDLQALKDKRDDAEAAYDTLRGEWKETGHRLRSDIERAEDLAGDLAREQQKARPVDDDARAYLDEASADLLHPGSPDAMAQFSRDLTAELGRRRRYAGQARQGAADTLKAAIGQYNRQWPNSAPDDTGDVDRSGADYAALHEEITARRLPEAMASFQRMIAQDMVPSVAVLQRAIEKESAAIRAQMGTVNDGLRRVEFNSGTRLQIAWTARQFPAAREFRQAVDDLYRHAAAVQESQDAAVAQFTRIRGLMARFTGTDPESGHWRDTVLDVRLSYVFYGREEDGGGITVRTYRNTASNSGGEQEKLVAFCLAAALSYNLGDASTSGEPRFAPLMLDEAFSKSDETFSAQALAAFHEFGFQLIMVAPIRMAGILEPFIGQAVLVEKREFPGGIASASGSATFGELAARREAEDGDA